ncbi:MAG: DUF423 domain-containing protein [Pseudobacteriovorax sp.]|nr:DUF423 domain-containing protein [Pseudobacteriovorax sp.]
MTWIHFSIVGALYCGLAVGFGAFGAHALKNMLSEYALGVFETGVKYQFYHGLALLNLGFLASRLEGTSLQVAGYSFIGGVIIFSGSLYTLSLTGHKWLGAITPLGGALFIVGWVSLIFALAAKTS